MHPPPGFDPEHDRAARGVTVGLEVLGRGVAERLRGGLRLAAVGHGKRGEVVGDQDITSLQVEWLGGPREELVNLGLEETGKCKCPAM